MRSEKINKDLDSKHGVGFSIVAHKLDAEAGHFDSMGPEYFNAAEPEKSAE